MHAAVGAEAVIVIVLPSREGEVHVLAGGDGDAIITRRSGTRWGRNVEADRVVPGIGVGRPDVVKAVLIEPGIGHNGDRVGNDAGRSHACRVRSCRGVPDKVAGVGVVVSVNVNRIFRAHGESAFAVVGTEGQIPQGSIN